MGGKETDLSNSAQARSKLDAPTIPRRRDSWRVVNEHHHARNCLGSAPGNRQDYTLTSGEFAIVSFIRSTASAEPQARHQLCDGLNRILELTPVDCQRLTGWRDLSVTSHDECTAIRHAYKELRRCIGLLPDDDPRRHQIGHLLSACKVPRYVGWRLGIWRPVSRDTTCLTEAWRNYGN